MQERHQDRRLYFQELARTSEHYFLPYIMHVKAVHTGVKVLEIGCGEGGNLVPFARLGCKVTGIDIATSRIRQARQFFQLEKLEGEFIAMDVFRFERGMGEYDIVLVHDVMEHILEKQSFLCHIRKFLKIDGVLFMGFPAWQMPFGGHQQIARNFWVSHFPFIHLLPQPLYKRLLYIGKETPDCVRELLHIRACRVTIEFFETEITRARYQIVDRNLWFINPHYEQKFGLKPRRLWPFLGRIPYLRNYFSTSCFYLLVKSANEKMP